MHAARCALQDAAGRVEACPGGTCPFWADGAGGLPGVCAVERLGLDLASAPDLAHALLRLRGRLEPRPDDGWALYHRLLPSAR
jgi:hypothetical protein